MRKHVRGEQRQQAVFGHRQILGECLHFALVAIATRRYKPV
jgi:hypothetical protein